eukprot:gnl/TRDRNA2_/TRDRNA2_73274_c0_seq1.p1 gnl/TRDRNA2_/TRDRNA2_73274_c0~~gnl/TRDRNA2_/TRDRNA2_73274_c0_seq1.p1  ORF type:complete len:422 (-),score=56.64 gnl/TRDRNA2_/TRDRNA2_73274_c0_seq1:33-1214(-)
MAHGHATDASLAPEWLFVCHDPGARNHLLPIVESYGAADMPRRMRLVDLRAEAAEAAELMEAYLGGNQPLPRLLVVGCSTNRSERGWVRSARAVGVRTLCVLDGGGTACRLDDLSQEEVCDGYGVSCEAAAADVLEHVKRATIASDVELCRCPLIRVVGDTYLEKLLQPPSSTAAESSRAIVRTQLGAADEDVVVALFASPEEPSLGVTIDHTLAALDALAAELAKCTACNRVFLWVRPHPRSSALLLQRQQQLIDAAVTSGQLRALLDRPERPGRHDNLAVFRALDVCLSWSSSVVDCACSVYGERRQPPPLLAFLKEGWPELDPYIADMMDWAVDSAIPRMSAADLRHSLDVHASHGFPSSQWTLVGSGWQQKHVGACERTWTLARHLLET